MPTEKNYAQTPALSITTAMEWNILYLLCANASCNPHHASEPIISLFLFYKGGKQLGGVEVRNL